MEPEICTKMLKKLSEKLRAKFPAATPGCSMLTIARLDDAFLEVFLTPSKLSRRPITAAKRKEKEKKERRKKFQKSKRKNKIFVFCACPSRDVVKRDASGKKGKLLCCKRIFDRIKANLAENQPKNHQNVQKNTKNTHFLQKAPGGNGLKWRKVLRI